MLRVRVTPGAGADRFERNGDSLRISIKAPPEDGKANARLVKLLAKAFKVPQSDVVITSGHTSRTKTLRVCSPRVIPNFASDG
ncbi:MAG: YggU family protein [Pseudomonadales bacterium]|nr:YggU family protein [Pseudomonadales bacterium]